MGKNGKKGSSGVYVPVLVVLLLIAVFFVGRLSSQVEMMREFGVATKEVKNEDGLAKGGEKTDGNEAVIGVSSLKKMASELGLDEKKFGSCLDEGKFEQKVKDDLTYGGELGVSGTPSFFINNVMVVGSQPQEIFEAVIDFELDGGNWDEPTEFVSYLVDGNPNNGEVTVVDGVTTGVGAVKGGNEAGVKIVEFSDFECPYCRRTLPTLEKLFEKYGDKISLEYRHFPLGFHSNAQKAAEASECAREQGKFWEMHDLIFGAQG